MPISINYRLLNRSLAIPTAVCDAVKLASGDALKCILYIFSHPDDPITPEVLAQSLSLEQESVSESLIFWESLSVLEGQRESATTSENTAAVDTSTVVTKNARALFSSNLQKPTRGEVANRIAEDENIAFMLRQAELYLGRTLTISDSGTLLALHDWAGLDPTVLLTLVAYCSSKKETSMRAIQKEALAWAEAGITCCEKAEAHIRLLEQQDQAVSLVRHLLHLPQERILKPAERTMAHDWICTMKIPKELIEEAGNRCLSTYGNIRFGTVGKTAGKWHTKGLCTLAEITAEEAVSLPLSKTKRSQGFISKTPSFTIEDLKVHKDTIPTYKRRGDR